MDTQESAYARSDPDVSAIAAGMSPYSTSSESSGRKGKSRFSAAAEGIVRTFGACVGSRSLNERNMRQQFKAVSMSSVASDRSEALSLYSRRSDSHGISKPSFTNFTLSELSKATGNFSDSNKIGQGGFGIVYKGKLKDGKMVAIKRANKNIYDRRLFLEFQSEIRTLSSIEHHNLVRFFGYLEDKQERILVIEYVPNGTLREHLDCKRGIVLELATRLDISIDVAHGITYLHMYTDQPVIHRDIKSSNILLTENFRAKVSDFGFAKLAPSAEAGLTHVSTQVKGTAGYLDPEYLKTYQLTPKSDVYSFGVLLVELITGRRPIEQKRELDERVTIRWALKTFMEGNAISLLDPNLERTHAANLAVEKILELAFHCCAPSRSKRPSMKKAAEVLWKIRKDYRDLLTSANAEPTSEVASTGSFYSAPGSRDTSVHIQEETSGDLKYADKASFDGSGKEEAVKGEMISD